MLNSEFYISKTQALTAEHIQTYQQLQSSLQTKATDLFYNSLTSLSESERKVILSIGEYEEGKLTNSLLMEALLKGYYEIFYLIAETIGDDFKSLITGKTADFDGQRLPFGISDRAFKNADAEARQAMLDKVAEAMDGARHILDYINDRTTGAQKNATDLLGMATFFAHTKLVAELVENPDVDLNQTASRNKAPITHAAANLEFRDNEFKILIDAARIKIDGTGVGQYQLTNLDYSNFQAFMGVYGDKFTTKEFNNIPTISMCFNLDGDLADGLKKLSLLLSKKLIAPNSFSEDQKLALNSQLECLHNMDPTLYAQLLSQIYPIGYMEWVVNTLNPKAVISYFWQPKTPVAEVNFIEDVDSFVLVEIANTLQQQIVSCE